ncbi:MAG TPA: hypothetical protein VGH33_23615, partial [Isosphaeraceae bacterium]
MMPLAGEVEELERRIQADLKKSFDYYEHTKIAWRLIQRLSDEGRPVSVENIDTGTVVDGPTLASLAQGYVTGYLAESVFQHLTTLFEDFLFGLLRCWLMAYPAAIPNKKDKPVDLATILDANDRDAIIETVIDRELDALKYKRPAAWFKYLAEHIKLGGPTGDQIEQLSEIKASRDVLVHSRGIVNEIYLNKAGARARYAAGQRL